jgi:malate dehydrogenase (oxaloacetate-decarboxylating)(NADP+)
MRETLALLRSRRPGWKSTAKCTATPRWTPRPRRADARSTLKGEANLLVLPNIDAANISYNLLKTAAGGGIAIGPVLLGAAKPVHILTPAHRAPHRQHDGPDRGRRQRQPLITR